VAEMSVGALEEKKHPLANCFGMELASLWEFLQWLHGFNFDVFSVISSRWEFGLLLDRWFLLSFWECACLRWTRFFCINLMLPEVMAEMSV